MAVARSLSHPYLTPLVGRDAEVELVLQQLTEETTRLLTLVGPGGVGKTRLALEVMDRLAGQFRAGTLLVDLAPLSDPRLVLSTIAHAVGLGDSSPRPLLPRLQEHLTDREVLLVLDNFEHLLPATIQLPELLEAAPMLRILVTSRVALPLSRQQTIRLSPLPVPDSATPLPLEQLAQIPSVALFVERAQAQRPDFVLGGRTASPIVELVRLLDGLPLALELAAGQLQVLGLPVIVRRLEQRVASLRWEFRDLPERQQSLVAAIGWSYDLLPTEEQRLFRHLGVFMGRVSAAGMAAVLGEDEEDALLGLIALTEKSLLLPVPLTEEEAEPAFGMLETVREYAREQLVAQGELETAAGAHAAYFLALAEEAEPRLRGTEQERWLANLETAYDNLRAALGWAREHGNGELGLRLASALGRFWEVGGHLTEGRTWLETTLVAAAVPVRTRAAALDTTGWLAFNQADYGRAAALFEEALALRRELGDRDGIAASLHGLGTIADRHGDLGQAVALLEEALALRRELGIGTGSPCHSTNLGALAGRRGDFRQAEALFEEALALLRELGDRRWVAVSLSNLGVLAYWRRDDERAEVLLEEALAIARTVGSKEWFHSTVLYLGYVASRRGDGVAAAAYYQETLQLCRDSGDRYHLPYALEASVWATRDQGDVERSARLYGAAAAVRASTHAVLAPHEATDREHKIEALRESMSAAAFERGWVAGQRMLPEEAIALALELLEEAERIPGSGTSETREPSALSPPSPLSPREQEVLRLAAEGLTSKQIGEQLFLSHRTVDHHLNSIYNKLGVDNRAQAVAVASRKAML